MKKLTLTMMILGLMTSCANNVVDKKYNCVVRLIEKGGVEAKKAAEVCEYTYSDSMEYVEFEGKDE